MPMNGKALRALLVLAEDSDSELVVETLGRSGFTVAGQRVDRWDSFVRALRDFAPDVVLADHGVPRLDARVVLDVLKTARPTTPLIVVCETIDEQGAVACLRAGAEDIVLTHNLARLAPAIEGALLVRRPLRRLSPRQLEVMRLIAEGRTTAAIAQRLGLSVKTVETHRTELMKRLGIHNLIGVVRYAMRVGLVPPAS
jgi:DNA-binding NarL/FixJ family response regulator